jgi:hypothetical protein
MKGGQMIRMAALAAIAGLGNALGGSIAGQGYRAGAIVPTNEYTTISPDVSQWGYANGPGWTASHVKRMAMKRRNRARNKAAHRKARSLT